MPVYFTKIIPVIIMFVLGFVSKKINLFKSQDADRFLHLVLNITLPALTVISLSEMKLSSSLFIIILFPIMIVVTTFFLSNLITSKLKTNKATKGAFLVGSLIINTGFVSTFIYAIFGREGFGYYSLFDLGNSIMIYFFAYYQAIRYSSKEKSQLPIIKMLTLPPIWGIIVGLIINLLAVKLPIVLSETLNYISLPTMPLIIFSLGIYFHPRIKNLKLSITALSLRMGLGAILGLLIISIFKLQAPVNHIVLICSTAPVGFNTLIFSELEGLDKEFAATIVSFSLILALVFITVYSYFI